MSAKLAELADRLAPLIAERVAEQLAERLAEFAEPSAPEPEPELIDAAEVARRFGVSRDYTYEHAERLGALRLGDGPRARLRFDPRRVAEALGAPEPEPAPERTAPRRRRPTVDPEKLLPIKRRT